jgi:hypothetical protein
VEGIVIPLIRTVIIGVGNSKQLLPVTNRRRPVEGAVRPLVEAVIGRLRHGDLLVVEVVGVVPALIRS